MDMLFSFVASRNQCHDDSKWLADILMRECGYR